MRRQMLMGAAIAALTMPAVVSAQQITSGIEGTVRSPEGTMVSGAQVTVTDTRTGSVRTLTTNDAGAFRTDNLVTGGPYTIAVDAPGYERQTIENAFINLQGNSSFEFDLVAGEGEIVVMASNANTTQLAIGPGQSFTAEDLADFPSITRDIRDIIRFDPRVRLDRANEVDRISCLGGNDRSNTFSVDGIVQSDVYGLNGTPFAARNALPLPFDSIRETSVEFAPFDVQYSQFTGCAVNVVTKSGSNDFHGSAFFTYTGDSLLGKKIDGDDFPSISFTEKRWGATLSGPIVRDHLFFFAGYEQTELGDTQQLGPQGAGYPNEQEFITQEQFNEIAGVIKDVYGIDTGGMGRDLAESSQRFFGRLDWYLDDRHRVELSYQRLEEENVEPDGLGQTVASGINSFESEGTVSNYYSARFYSNWTDSFSTEVRVSRSEVQDVQGPVGGGEAQSDNPIPRIVVGVSNGDEQGSFFAGPGFSRTSNDLRTEITQFKVAANWKQGNHRLTFGGELNNLHVFNLFGQNTTGTLTFANIDDLRAGLLSGGTSSNPNAQQINDGQGAGAYGNFTASGNINDAAAVWTRSMWTVYAQDDWQITPRLDVQAGVRIDWLDGDAPAHNANFFDRYGYSNAIAFSKFDPLVMPRLGITYDLQNDGFLSRTQLKGGVGLFSGGDPTVWFSNAFQNNGVALGFGSTGNNGSSCGPVGTRLNVLQGGQFTGIPQCIRDDAARQASGALADTQSVDPDFTIPTVLRANFGIATTFGTPTGFFSNWRLNLDYIYSRFQNPVTLVDLAQVVNPALGLNGYSVDGRPIYRSIESTRAGCNAQLLNQGGSPPQYANVNAACFGTSRDDEIQLTNGRDYNAHTVSVILQKAFQSGLFTDGGSVRFNLGYAYNNAKNNRYNNGTTATGNFDGAALFDLQDVAVATAEFETRHNITFGLDFSEKFVGDYATQFGIAFFATEGRPYSFTFNSPSTLNFGNTAASSFVRFTDEQSGAGQLLYVPTGLTDANVDYRDTVVGGRVTQTAAQVAQSLDSYISDNECLARYRGQSIPRNTCRNDWYYDMDLRISQELPGPGRLLGVNDKLRVYADFDNFLNLLDSGWNLSRSRGTSIPVVQGGVDREGRYVYTNFNPNDDNDVTTSASLWRIQVGLSYQF